MILPVILAGGSGTRLWPLSRGNYPKQFLKLNGDLTMLQQTINRLNGLEHSPCMLICNEEHRFVAAEQIHQLGINHGGIFLEPVGRNTAPAIALAALHALDDKQHPEKNNDEDPVLLVLAADHLIENQIAFQNAVKQAYQYAKEGKLVTFGIAAQTPETGYGYIRRGKLLKNTASEQSYYVNHFVEKPDLETATSYVDSGEYYWNSGMFMFKASRYLELLKQFRNNIYLACKAAMQVQTQDLDFIRVDKESFILCPDESIDYAILEPLCQNEQADEVILVPLDAGWSDIGSFNSLWQVSKKDQQGNALKGDIKLDDSNNCLIISEDKLVTVIGVEDLVIINTKDSVLISHRDKASKINTIVNQLKDDKRPEVSFHREVYRPWGKYDLVDTGTRFQVKRITVKPGAKLSLQMHHHRAEHWIVVSGTAKVMINQKEQLLTENESVYIPITAIHCLENPGKVVLELIEVQSGLYLGEDDIVRY